MRCQPANAGPRKTPLSVSLRSNIPSRLFLSLSPARSYPPFFQFPSFFIGLPLSLSPTLALFIKYLVLLLFFPSVIPAYSPSTFFSISVVISLPPTHFFVSFPSFYPAIVFPSSFVVLSVSPAHSLSLYHLRLCHSSSPFFPNDSPRSDFYGRFIKPPKYSCRRPARHGSFREFSRPGPKQEAWWIA